jgi:hypothetical protein
VDDRRDVKTDVDQQEHRGGEPLVRNQSAKNVGRTPAIDCPFADLFMAVGANAIFFSDERPAMRAHAA